MNTTTKTKHSDGCCKAFAKLDPTCPRCQELAKGAPARRGWGPPVRSLQHGTMQPIVRYYAGNSVEV